MSSRKARTRQVRRDRRKAKASGWRRQGKRSWAKVGHGAGGGGRQEEKPLAMSAAGGQHRIGDGLGGGSTPGADVSGKAENPQFPGGSS